MSIAKYQGLPAGVFWATAFVVLLISILLHFSLLVLEIEGGGFLAVGVILYVLPWLLATSRRRDLTLGMSLTVVVAVITLGVAEAGARWYSADITTTDEGSLFFRDRWEEAQVTRNSLGYREREIVATPVTGVYRIAVLGDSLTFGQGIAAEERLSNRLEQRLQEDGGLYEVLNFGTPGAETVDELETLRETILPIHPDYLLLQWFPNDVEGHDKSGRARMPNLVPSKRVHYWFSENSALYGIANIGFHRVLASSGFYTSYLDYLSERFSDAEGADWQGYEKELRGLIELARSYDLPLAIYLDPLFVPQLAQGNYPLAYIHDRVLAICADYGVSCLDLREAYSAVEDLSSLTANRYEGHPSAFANEIMADEVYKAFHDDWTTTAAIAAHQHSNL